ncbi:MAG: hypothetical protein QOF18_2029 [Frankiaceae bacterium]|nr:hypothetical protein [Frankiaceae bacterium]
MATQQSRATARTAVMTTLALVIGLVVSGGIAIAAVRQTTITACAAQGTHAMRFAPHGTCKSTEKKLVWNTQGRRGPIGPSAAYAAFRASGPSDLTTTQQTIATLAHLPAGAYLIQATTEVNGDASANATDVLCTLHAGADAASADAYAGTVAGGTYVAVLPMLLTHTFTSVGAVTVSCSKDLAHPASMSNTRIVATRLGVEHHSNVTG